MRTSIFFLIIALLAAACQPAQTDGIAALSMERDSLKALISDYNDRIIEINKLIAESDSGFINKLTLVEVETVAPKKFEHYFEIYGAVETSKNILLYPETQGLVNNLYVKEGDKVSRGQVLASLDNQIIRSQISELETNLSLARTTFEKQERLWNQKIGSELQYLQAKNQKESLESSLATLRSQLSKSQMTAPFSGVVDEIFPKQGEMANPQMPVFRIVNLDDMYVKSDVSEQHLRTVKTGTSVQVDLPSVGKTLEASITEVSKFINPENRSFKVRVDLPENEADLRPNQLAYMRINDYSNAEAIVLASSVVMQTSEGKDYVYVLQEVNGETYAKRQEVVTGHEYDGKVEIMEGLDLDTRVITRGGKSVRDGQRVRLS